MAAARKPPGFVDYLLLVSLALIFGISFNLTSVAVRDIPPLSVAAGRLLIAFVLLHLLMKVCGQRLPGPGSVWWWIVASGLFGNALPFALISWGQVDVDAGLTAIFMAIMPLVTLFLAHLFTDDEKLNGWKFAGVVSGILGVIVLMGWTSLATLGEQFLRQVAILGGAVCYAINALITRRLVALPRWSAMAALMLVATLWLLPFSVWLDRPWLLPVTGASMLAVITLAIVPTALATVLLLNIVARQGASFLSQINFMVPVFGMLSGVILLGERLPANAYVALVIILTGIALSRLGSVRQ